MTELAFSALAILLVTVGPVEVAAMFMALTAGASAETRRRLALGASMIGAAVLVAFALGGNRLFALLQVGLPAFRTAGGILLLRLSADMLLARHSGLSSITRGEEREAAHHADIAVFPLAIPLIAGPGSMTAVVLLMGRAGDAADAAMVVAAIGAVVGLTLAAMLAADRLVRLLGLTGINVIARVSGILLAALAMQFVLDGLGQSGLFH
jgi:multiple antibiotic resistance protein